MEKRINIVRIVILVVILILEFRLFQLQILEGEKYKTLSDNNRIRIIREEAPRGIIYDRNGNPLAINQYKYQVYLTEDTIFQKKRIREKLEKIFSLNLGEFLNKQDKEFILIKDGASIQEITKVLEDFELSGITTAKIPVREYLESESMSHLLGYVGEITKEKLEKLEEKGYNMKDIIGFDGIECSRDEILRGERGGGQIEVDSEGRKIRVIGYRKPTPGANIYLTIDKRIQKITDEAMDGRIGAAIVINPENGEILSMVSKPSYHPEFFNKKITKKEWDNMVNHPYYPLQNRVISSKYPPGSVFKIITLAAALENNITNEKEIFNCSGEYKVGNRIFRCWNSRGHGKIDLVKGIAHSCDVVFYTLGERLGVEQLKKFSFEFGLAKETGVELPGEVKGTVPDKKWKRINFRGGRWFTGDTINMSIGQGFLQVTPIQMAVATSIIANGGYKIQPHLIKKIERNNEEVYPLFERTKLDLKEENLKIIKEGMRLSVEGGTAKLCKIPGIQIAGKTGTAEDPPKPKPHAWFIGFAPYEKPKYCIVVFIEQGGKGGEVATPIAREIFEKIFEREKL